MTEHLLEAYRADFETRTKDRGLYTVGAFPEGHAVNAHEIRAGVVYKDANVTVTAFATKHAMESYGYRFDTPDRSIVISGDTNPTQATIDACRGCDVLVHEVLTLEWLAKRPDFQGYAAQFHTTTAQLIELATKAKPRLLVLYHASLSLRPAVDSERSTPATLLREMSRLCGAGRRRPRSGRLLIRSGLWLCQIYLSANLTRAITGKWSDGYRCSRVKRTISACITSVPGCTRM